MPPKNTYKTVSDDELFGVLEKDKKAENEFYRRYKIRVKSFLKNYKLNPMEREDMIQEGMIGLFHAIQTFDKEKGFQFSTYSNACIRNRIYNALDKYWKHRKKIDAGKDIEEMVAKSDPENDTIRMELKESLKSGIASLTELEQKIVREYLERKSYKQIAEELAISSKKVDNILVKAKTKLSHYLQSYHRRKEK
jgi:RNA polymerase sporulation-specific sigma factor